MFLYNSLVDEFIYRFLPMNLIFFEVHLKMPAYRKEFIRMILNFFKKRKVLSSIEFFSIYRVDINEIDIYYYLNFAIFLAIYPNNY
ncbi:MAG: hypothetical protein CK427_00235 [Leptospira sp.]|nr:MAG: hypothetical protein CK427_00235 [Leptospira sp.]